MPRVRRLEPSGVEIAIPEGAGIVYVMSSATSYYVSRRLEGIADAVPLELSLSSAVRFLENRNSVHETLFENLQCFPPGTTVRYVNRTARVSWAYESAPEKAQRNPAAVLQDILASMHLGANVAVDFSGGLDSTAIVHTLHALAAHRMVACTWHDPHGSAPDDLEWAQRIAKQLKIEHLVVAIDDKLLWNVPSTLPGMPTSAFAFQGMLEDRQRVLRRHFGDMDFRLINGHGGDQVFLDPVPPEVFLTILRHAPSKAARVWSAYSSLYGIDPLRAIRHARRARLSRSPLLSEHARALQPADRERSTHPGVRDMLIREAVSQNASMVHSDARIAHPFTDRKMIQCALSYQYHELFNAEFARHPLRVALAHRYGHDHFFRNSKGHMTGAYQRAIRSRETEFRDMVTRGALASAGLIDVEAACSALRRCAVGYAGGTA